MTWCVSPELEVTNQTVTVLQDTSGSIGRQTFRITAPTGKKPLSGGYDMPFSLANGWPDVLATYPDGDDWVFVFFGKAASAFSVNLYLVSMLEG